MSLRQLAYWDGGLESLQGLTCLSFVSVVCFQLEGSVIARSGKPTEYGVSECGRGTSYWRLMPTRAIEPRGEGR